MIEELVWHLMHDLQGRYRSIGTGCTVYLEVNTFLQVWFGRARGAQGPEESHCGRVPWWQSHDAGRYLCLKCHMRPFSVYMSQVRLGSGAGGFEGSHRWGILWRHSHHAERDLRVGRIQVRHRAAADDVRLRRPRRAAGRVSGPHMSETQRCRNWDFWAAADDFRLPGSPSRCIWNFKLSSSAASAGVPFCVALQVGYSSFSWCLGTVVGLPVSVWLVVSATPQLSKHSCGNSHNNVLT